MNWSRISVALVKVRHRELANHGHLDHATLGLVASWREPSTSGLVAILLLLLLLLLVLEAKLAVIVLEQQLLLAIDHLITIHSLRKWRLNEKNAQAQTNIF